MASRLIQALVAEVRRRKVFRAVVLYAIGAWVVLQVGEVTFEPMGLPEWAMQALIIAVIVGFPLVFVLTWCVDLGPEGLMFDLPLWRGLDPDQVGSAVDQLVEGLFVMTAAGWVHGDLSAFNLLWWNDELWFIDLPQAVQLAANPQGLNFLQRDVMNVCAWFRQRGRDVDGEALRFSWSVSEGCPGLDRLK